MREPEPGPGNGTTGVVGRARAFLAACAQYTSARVRLASIEGREAAGHGFKLLLIAGAAIVLAAFGWLFVCLAAVFLLAKALGGDSAWVWAALVMAGLHLATVILLALALRSKLRKTLFPMTIGELKKDQEWLDQQTRKNTQS
jgi:uncharacterized membrane protein YqjE